ncbi:MAG: tRNA (guanosine(37)-N1)-methyltransferase TrmD [Gammaproteobacteria bacterium]
MRIGVVTLLGDLVRAVISHGVVGRAAERGLISLSTWDPRTFARDRHRTVDDAPYGGGPGMVMLYEPIRQAIDAARASLPGAPVIHLSPQGPRLDQARVRALASAPAFILLCGRYEGIDERVVESCVDAELSIGDYVLSGGELAAMVVIDAVTRLLPGALGDDRSAQADSFVDGLLDYPHYTRPETVDGRSVPPVLLSGDHGAIARWRRQQALYRTWRRRPDLFAGRTLERADRMLLDAAVSAEGACAASGNESQLRHDHDEQAD